MEWARPVITDYGSIGDHTFCTPGGNVKGGGIVQHLDIHGEWSSGFDTDKTTTVTCTRPGQPTSK